MAKPMFGGMSVDVAAGRQGRSLRIGYDRTEAFWSSATVNAASVSFGVRTQTGPLHLAAYAGPSVVWGTAEYEPGRPLGARYLTVGAALDASILVELGTDVKLGVGAQGNVNPELSTFGAGPRLRVTLGGRR